MCWSRVGTLRELGMRSDAGFALPAQVSLCSYKRVKGRSHTGGNKSARTHTNPMCVPAEACGVYGVVRLSPPPQPARLLNQPAGIAPGLRSGLRWLKRSCDHPVGCGCWWWVVVLKRARLLC